jgi:tetratricopeptide (TPR) repeat protein
VDEKLILIVEDEYAVELGLRKKLEKEGFYVSSVAGGEGDTDILENILSQKPHILVIGSGTKDEGEKIDLLEKIKNEDRLKDCEIFIFAERIEIPLLKKLRSLKLKNYFTVEENMSAQLAEQIRRFFKGWDDTHVFDLSMINGILGEELTDGKPSYHTDISAPQTNLPSEKTEGNTDFALGEKMMDSGKYEQALELMRKASENKHLRERALISSGICLRKLKKYREAIETLQAGAKETVELVGKTHFRYQLGITLEEVGKNKEALQFYDAVEKADSSYHGIGSRIIELKKRLQGK